MSKFIDRLSLILSGVLAPMGFRAAGVQPRPKMVLVAHIAPGAAKSTGADAILLSIPKTGIKSPKALTEFDVPWGGWLEEVTASGVKQLRDGGADFIVFPAASVLKAILEEERMGKIVAVEAALDAGLLKTIDDLPVDAVLIAEEKSLLTWQEFMLFRRCANILIKPLLVTVSPDIADSELQALCEAGVGGVVVRGKLEKLRLMIDRLPAPKAGKRRKVEPLVPRIGGETGTVSEEEED